MLLAKPAVSKICVFPVNIQALFPVMDCSTLFRLWAQHTVSLHVRSIDKEGPRCYADESCVCLDQATAQEMPKCTTKARQFHEIDIVREYYIPIKLPVQFKNLICQPKPVSRTHTLSVSLRIFTRLAQLPCQK